MKPRTAALAVGLLLLPCVASADAIPGVNGGWYLPFGVNVGGSIHHDLPGGFLLGGEASIVNYNEIGPARWIGAYADGLWDFGPDEFRFSVGPELGIGPFGVDVGYLGSVRESTYRNGIVVRGMLTVSLLALYGRWGHEFTTGPANFGEVGVLIKLPFPVGDASRGRQRPERPPEPPPPPPPPPPVPPPTLQVPSPEPPPERDFATPP